MPFGVTEENIENVARGLVGPGEESNGSFQVKKKHPIKSLAAFDYYPGKMDALWLYFDDGSGEHSKDSIDSIQKSRYSYRAVLLQSQHRGQQA